MNHKLLMIGAGEAQMKGIQLAIQSGFYVIAVDGNQNAPGLTLANEGFVIDTKDLESLTQLAISKKVNFVTSVSCEICLPTVGYLNDYLGLPGITKKVADTMTNKGEMRKIYERNGIYCPRFYILSNVSDLSAALNYTGFPCVLKPVDSAGSQGVRFLNSPFDSDEIFRQAMQFSKSGQVIIEQFIPGSEISFEGFVIDGELHCLALSDKIRTPPPYLLDTEVIFPSSVSKQIYDQVLDLASKAVKALDLNNLPIHMEIILSDHGPVIVEIAARGPGFRVYTDLIPYVSGVSPLQIQLDLLLGKKFILKQLTPQKSAIIKFISGRSGTLKDITCVPEDIPEKQEIRIYKKVGDQINDLTSGRDRIGHILVYGENRDITEDLVEKIFKVIKVTIE